MAAPTDDNGIQAAPDPHRGHVKAADVPSAVHADNSAPLAADAESEIAVAAVDSSMNLQTLLAFIALCGQFNAYVMTLLVPSTAVAYINQDLGPDPNYTWITVSWQLGASVVVSVGGRLSDIFGRRYFMLTGSLISIVGCIVGATGQSINQMIASGVLFGIGSGFQEMSYACVQEILPNKHRMLGIGIFDFSLTFAYMTPIISYKFIGTYALSWRASYWYMFSFHSLFFLLLFFCYKPPDFRMKHRSDGKTRLQLLAELDYVGLSFFVAASTLILAGINFGGRKFPWASGAVIAPIVVGFACAVALGFWETMADLKYPLLPPKLFKKVRAFDMIIVICFVGGMLYYSMNVLWPQQSAQFFIPADQPVMRGVYSTLFSFGSLIGALIMIFISSRIGHEKWQLVAFMAAQTAFISAMASVGIDDKARAIVLVLLAAAMVTPPQLISFTMLSLDLDDQTDIGIAVGLAGTFRLMGGAVATAIYTAILTNRYTAELPTRIYPVAAQYGVDPKALLTAAKVNTPAAYASAGIVSDAVRGAAGLAVKLSYVAAFKLVYLVAIAFGGLAIAAAFCTVSTDSRKKNDERAVRLRNEVGVGEEESKQVDV